MPLPARQQTMYWGIAAAAFFLVLWQLGNVLMPFILGAAIAYLLDPLADMLEDMGLSRAAATALISIFGIMAFIILLLLIVPLLLDQAFRLVETLPEAFRQLQDFVNTRFPSALEEDSVVRQQIVRLGEALQSRAGSLLNGLISSVQGIINLFVVVLIVPVVAIYLLLDWDKMVERVDNLLPLDHAPTIRTLVRQMDRTMSSFIRGQGTVCFIIGCFYTVSLMALGLNFALVAGFFGGLMTFIPFLGSILGGVVAIGLALFQFWGGTEVVNGETVEVATQWWKIVAVALVYQLGQIIEGNILTPRLVGGSVGLHPVMILLSLSLFGALFGFVGLLVAVPVTAMIGVLVRFFIDQYRDSRLYRGVAGRRDEDGWDGQ